MARTLTPEQTERQREYQRAYVARHPERRRETVRLYHETHREQERADWAAKADQRNAVRRDRRREDGDTERASSRRSYYKNILPDKERMAEKSRKSVEYSRMRKFGVSPADYDRMFAAQGGVCAICSKPPGAKALHVDHDHKTGKVRKLLCHLCNTAIGQLEDDASVVLSAYVYLLTASAP